jgi:diguanylate cyclase (GGDEF)-like protein
LAFRFSNIRRRLGSPLRPVYLPAVIATLVVGCGAIFVDRQNLEIHRQELRADTLARVNLIRAKLEGNFNGNLQLVRGLVAIVASEPDIDQRRFSEVVGSLLTHHSQLINVTGAPDFIVRFMHPIEGIPQILGMNYLENERLRGAALKARDSGEPVVSGPIDLVSGGRGFIGRFPVYVRREEGGREFWGLVSAIIDMNRLYVESGIAGPDLPFNLAMTGDDGTGAGRKRFFGSADVLADDPVTADILLPSGSWRLSAVPKGGWDTLPENAWLLRFLMLIGGSLIVMPIVMTGRLIGERQNYIGELKSREGELERLSRRLALALETSQVGVWDYDIASGELLWDQRMDELHGLPSVGGVRSYEDWRAAIHPDDLERAEREFFEATGVTGRYNSEYRLRLLGGQVRHIRAIGAVYQDTDGTAKMVGVNLDVSADVVLHDDLKRAKTLTEARNTELLMAKARIEHNALHDSLTGLPNRRYLDQRIDLLSSQPDESGARIGLLHIDLDRFKQINDTLGHAAGDAMLVHASDVLQRNARPTDFVARVGGDEFVVMCRLDGAAPEGDAPHLAALADRIIQEMRLPVQYENHQCRFGVSVGIAADGANGDLRRLLVNADIALYRAKSRGRNCYQFFNAALEAEIVQTKRVADEILSGLEQGQFIPYFQPQFDAETLEVAGAEALARWNHPTRGLLGPDAFMKTAEELNVVSIIDRIILEQALVRFGEWQAAGLAVPKISVNVSARRLQDEELMTGLRRLKIVPGTVSFELVESIFLDEKDDQIIWAVEQIKELGIDIEIDDFGTGYASIVSLLKLKPRRLKIDQQLVMPILDSPAQRDLVESIIDIGKSLGIDVIAEGVETMEHARILRKLGCETVQGYAFAKALSNADFERFLRERLRVAV